MTTLVNRPTLKILSLAIVALLISFTGQAFAKDPVYTSFFSNKAVGGYDAVSYFQEDGTPQKGSDAFSTKWRGATWQFTSQANLDTFVTNPEKYAPQYGGYCAWAMADGILAKGDPTVFDIHNGKLYLNYNQNIRDRWAPTKDEFITKADVKHPETVDLN